MIQHASPIWRWCFLLLFLTPSFALAQEEGGGTDEPLPEETQPAAEGEAPKEGEKPAEQPKLPSAEAELTPAEQAARAEEKRIQAIFGSAIPAGGDLSPAEIEELEAYREAALRYVVEVKEYRADLANVVQSEYDRKLAEIERVYSMQIDQLTEEERKHRREAIAMLEAFLVKHPHNETYGPGVLYRLAVLHYEKADDEFYSSSETLDQSYPDFSTSVGYLERLIREYPDFPQLDGAYYLLGFTRNQMEQKEEAKTAFAALVEKYPESQKAPEAYTRIGEYYFEKSQAAIQGFGEPCPEGQSCIYWQEAKDSYASAVSYGDEYGIYDRALYRLAWTDYYMEDYDSMIRRFMDLVEYADKVPQGSALRQEAIEFMAAVLAEEDWNLNDDIERDPDFGMTRFDRYLNEGKSYELEVLKMYGDTLFDLSRFPFAAEAYIALLERDPCNPENPKVHKALISAYKLNYETNKANAIEAELDGIYGRGSEWYKCQEQQGNLEAIAFAEGMARESLSNAFKNFYASASKYENMSYLLREAAATDNRRDRAAIIGQALEMEDPPADEPEAIEELQVVLAEAGCITPAEVGQRISGDKRQAYLLEQATCLETKSVEAYALSAEKTQSFLEKYPNDRDIYLNRYILADAYFRSGKFAEAAEQFSIVRDVTDGRFRRDAALGAIDSYNILLTNKAKTGEESALGLEPAAILSLTKEGIATPAEVPTYILDDISANHTVDDDLAVAVEAEREARLKAREARENIGERIEIEQKEISDPAKDLMEARSKYVEYKLDQRRSEQEDPLESTYAYLDAMVYFHHGDYDEARKRFDEIIERWPESDIATYAVGFIIFTYQEEGDLDAVTAAIDKYSGMELGGGADAETDAKLFELKFGTLFKKAKIYFDLAQKQAAEGNMAEARVNFEKAAVEFERIVDENPDFPDIHLALFNAGVAYERIKKYESAMRLYRRVYTEYNDTEEAPDALFRVAVNSKKFFDFETAVSSYEELYEKFSDAPVGDQADYTCQSESYRTPPHCQLKQAAVILKYTEKQERAATFFKQYHDTHTEQSDAPRLLYEAGLMYEQLNDYKRMADIFEKFRKLYGKDPQYRELVLESYTKQADYYYERKDYRKAGQFYERVLSNYEPDQGGNYFAAKAQFQIADIEFQEWSEIKLGGKPKVFQKKVAQKKEGLQKIAPTFQAVTNYKSGEWSMAALYRIGSMFHNFAESLRTAECPPALDEDTCFGFKDQLLEASFEIDLEARKWYESVVEFGKNNSIVNDWTRAALNGLNDLFPKEYPIFEGERQALEERSSSPRSLLLPSTLDAAQAEAKAEAADRETPKDVKIEEEEK